jgi:hypothetical protein
VHQEAEHAAGALRELQRFSFRQSAWQHLTIAVLAMAVTVAAVWWYVPSMTHITALRAEQSKLQASIEDLNQRGGGSNSVRVVLNNICVCSSMTPPARSAIPGARRCT